MGPSSVLLNALSVGAIVAHRGHDHAGQTGGTEFQQIAVAVAMLSGLGVVAWYAYSVFG